MRVSTPNTFVMRSAVIRGALAVLAVAVRSAVAFCPQSLLAPALPSSSLSSSSSSTSSSSLSSSSSSSSSSPYLLPPVYPSIRSRFERLIHSTQEDLTSRLSALDSSESVNSFLPASNPSDPLNPLPASSLPSSSTFRTDDWSRPEGGYGKSMVLQNGRVFEKAGVNLSVVYGRMPADAVRAATPKGASSLAAAAGGKSESRGSGQNDALAPVPFYASGISSVIHPLNPYCPTLHFNFRYFESVDPVTSSPRCWFGGGIDLTPSYVSGSTGSHADCVHFHRTLKEACDKHSPSYYPKFKSNADRYFYIPHRKETRGIGGVFFDDLNEDDDESRGPSSPGAGGKSMSEILDFVESMAGCVGESYLPVLSRRKGQPFGEREKRWQLSRRGRYVEFNLMYDRGTTFGLKTNGRVESILMSLPGNARWEYDMKVEEGSDEERAMKAFKEPVDWLSPPAIA